MKDPQARCYELFSMVPYRERAFTIFYSVLVPNGFPIAATLTFGDDTIEAMRSRTLSSQWFHVPTFDKIACRYFELMEKGSQEELNEFVKQERERTKEVHQVITLCGCVFRSAVDCLLREACSKGTRVA